MRKILYFIFAINIILYSSLFASYNKEISKSMFERANKLYESGDIEKAFNIYKELAIEDKVSSKDLYYNLATLYEVMGEKGNAVLWYERLLLIDPFDKEAHSRLSLMIDGYSNNLKAIFIIIHIFLYLFLLSFTISLVFFIISIVNMRYKKTLRKIIYTLLVISVILVSFTAYFQIRYNKTYIIITRDNVSLYKGNNLQSDSLKVLNEGSKLKVLEEYNYWWYVQMPNGELGWIYKEDSQKI